MPTHINSFQAWFNLGFLAQRLFFHQAAIEYYEKSESLARAQGDDENVSRVLFSLGSLYGEEEDWNRACECYEKALLALKGCEKSSLMRPILGNLGSIYRLQGEYHQAASCYSRVLDVLDSDDRAGRADALDNLGYLYQMNGDLSRAEECYNECLKERELAHDLNGTARALAALSSIYQLTGNGKRAQSCLEAARHHLEDLDDKAGSAEMQNRLGDMYFQEGRFREALDSYEKCTLALQESDPSLASQALSRMAQCFLEQGELIQAEDHLQRSIAIMEELGDSCAMADALLLLAGIHHRQGLTEEALLCSRQCLEIKEQRKDQSGVVAALNYMGLIQTERQDWAMAEECYQRVAVISHGKRRIPAGGRGSIQPRKHTASAG